MSQVGDIVDNTTIASNVVTHYESNCQHSSIERNDSLKSKQVEFRVNHYGNPIRDGKAF